MKALWVAGILTAVCPLLPAYSVLTHEAIIDVAWDQSLKPLLIARFPGATADQLIGAHAYAYGGSILQDMGYYPFGSRFFSDLVHYVRSGDFVVALIRDAENLDEYAFALGALAHYAADNEGHPIAVNRVVPMLYPKLRAMYGDVVTYEDNPAAHLKTEFGFDVVEIAHGNYAPQSYHDFIGFQVSKELLERGFQDTYGIALKDTFASLDLALGTYRHTVSSIIPEMTKAAWSAKKKEIQQAKPDMTKQKFIYRISRASYEREWNKQYERPGPGARFLAFLFRILPKVGPFRALGFHVPTPAGEKLFMESFNKTQDRYRQFIADVRAQRLQLPNDNFDTGEQTRAGSYRMADQTYEKLLEKLADAKVPPPRELRANIVEFYQPGKPELSQKARTELEALSASAP